MQRVWQVANADGQPKNSEQIATAYDRFGARFSLLEAGSFRISGTADLFALGGVGADAATAVRFRLSATRHTRGAGSFTLSGDWGKIVRNQAGDPFYDLPASRHVIASWNRAIRPSLSLRLYASYGKGPAVQPFGWFGAATPELNDGARQFACGAAVTYAR